MFPELIYLRGMQHGRPPDHWRLRLRDIAVVRADEAWAAATRDASGSVATRSGTSPLPSRWLRFPLVGNLAGFAERLVVAFVVLAWAEHLRLGHDRGWARVRAVASAAGFSAVVAREHMARHRPPATFSDDLGRRATAVARAGRVVALTFDDGPSPEHTPGVLETLARAHVPATFFLVGECVLAHPDEFRAILDAGHEIGSHTMSHASLVGLDDETFAAEVDGSCSLLREMSGRPVRRFRPPYGNCDGTTRRRLADRSLETVMWTVDPQDYLADGPARIVSHVARKTRPGAIVLLHDAQGDRSATVAALPQLICALRRRGFTFVTLDDLASG
ncbi:MAG: peptidoglycan-N-acetylglucosamine deacetylase [Actinomycetia bacterium]|nr:peptidoglycan-N-acetylglucosamine deacetylase [Actinomycetes bacterium]